MKIYINLKQIFVLLLPLLLWGVYIFFENEIKNIVKTNFFYSNKKEKFYIDEEAARKYLVLSNKIDVLVKLKKSDKDQSQILSGILKPKYEEIKISSPSKRRWRLKYTIISNGEKRALLNGKIVKIGDKVYDAYILDIQKNRIKIKTVEGVIWVNILD